MRGDVLLAPPRQIVVMVLMRRLVQERRVRRLLGRGLIVRGRPVLVNRFRFIARARFYRGGLQLNFSVGVREAEGRFKPCSVFIPRAAADV